MHLNSLTIIGAKRCPLSLNNGERIALVALHLVPREGGDVSVLRSFLQPCLRSPSARPEYPVVHPLLVYAELYIRVATATAKRPASSISHSWSLPLPRIEDDLAEALRLLGNYFDRLEIPFALVGALVPALLLSSEIGARETRDADHVIGLQSWAAWESVIAGLETLGFTRGRGEQEHRLYYRTAEIDLIPYGVSNGPDDVLIWPRSGNYMNMTGFGDVFRYAVPTEVSPGITVPVVLLWLFAVLKVIAFLDRQFP